MGDQYCHGCWCTRWPLAELPLSDIIRPEAKMFEPDMGLA